MKKSAFKNHRSAGFPSTVRRQRATLRGYFITMGLIQRGIEIKSNNNAEK